MFATVEAAVEAAREAAAVADPDALDGSGAIRLLEAGEEIERLDWAIKLLAAQRLAETRAWKRAGDPSAAHFVARRTGASLGQATGTMKTARRLDPHGAIAEAMKGGELSAEQAAPIAEACEADPHAEKALLEKASSDSVQELRDECRRVTAAAHADELAHDDAIRRSRYVRAWTDNDGAGRGEWKLPPDAQALVMAHLAVATVAREAKAAGAPSESREAYAADALVRTAESGGSHAAQVVMHLRDHSAFERGHTEPARSARSKASAPSRSPPPATSAPTR